MNDAIIEYHVEVNILTYEIEHYWRLTYIYNKKNLFYKTFPEFIGHAVNVHGQSGGFCVSFNDLEFAYEFKRRMIGIYDDYVSIHMFSSPIRQRSYSV